MTNPLPFHLTETFRLFYFYLSSCSLLLLCTIISFYSTKWKKQKSEILWGTENNGAQSTKFTFGFMQELFQAPQFLQNLSHKPAYNFHFLPSLYIYFMRNIISYRIQYPVRGLEDELLCIFNILRNLQQQKHIKLDLNPVFASFS